MLGLRIWGFRVLGLRFFFFFLVGGVLGLRIWGLRGGGGGARVEDLGVEGVGRLLPMFGSCKV